MRAPLNLMEDAATAEISRSQVWQWVRHRAALDDGRTVTPELVREVMAKELAALGPGSATRAPASNLFDRLATHGAFEEFLTLPAYELLLSGL